VDGVPANADVIIDPDDGAFLGSTPFHQFIAFLDRGDFFDLRPGSERFQSLRSLFLAESRDNDTATLADDVDRVSAGFDLIQDTGFIGFRNTSF